MLSYIFIYEILSRVFVVAAAKELTTKISKEMILVESWMHCVQTKSIYQINHTFETQIG